MDNLETATPEQIDTRLSELWTLEDRYRDYLRRALRSHQDAVSRGWQRQAADVQESIDKYRAEIAKYREQAAPLEQEHQRRGGWSRFFLVVNTNGHVHSSMGCASCFPTTRYSWLPQLSGRTEAEAVAEWGERMCTVCFPTAPTDPNYNRPARIDREAATERAAAKAAREREKELKGISNPDGSPVQGRWGVVKTERTAQIEYVDSVAYARHLRESGRPDLAGEYETVADRLLTGLAHKRGSTREQQRERLAEKVDKKYRKDYRPA